MSPGASLAVTHLTGVLDCGKSTLLVPAAEGPCGADTSEAEHHLNGAIQTVALVEDRPIARHDLEIFLNLLKRTAGPRLLCLGGLVALADDPDRPLVLHPGQPATRPLERLATWPSRDRRTRIIAITRDLDPAILQRLFAYVTGPWPDRLRIRVAMAAVAAMLVVFAVGLAVALHSNAGTTVEAWSATPRTQDRGF
jgi:hypothetical protein